MQQNFNHHIVDFHAYDISYLAGSAAVLTKMQEAPSLEPFSCEIMHFLNQVSRLLLEDQEARAFADVITLAFWMRRASLETLKKRFQNKEEGRYPIGRGIVFHIAPSNVPVNYAYSLAAGLLCGNANIVRVPSKDFPQINIINRAINRAIEMQPIFAPYLVLLRYGHDSSVNDALSAIADVRVVWGGDATIAELRKSKLKARAGEITFADRYSLAVIDSNVYMELENKTDIANGFYNDTYLTDQNACTSPRIVVWTGSRIGEAQKQFWEELYKLVKEKYEIQGVQAVNKLTSSYLLAVCKDNVKKEGGKDNRMIRMRVQEAAADLMDLKDNSGYFFEYECNDIMELKDLCNDSRCQTVSYIGGREMFLPLVKSGIKGIDRIVPIGKTMDFDLIWDGYNLFERLTRIVFTR